MVLGENVSRLFNVNELPKRTTDCCIAEKRGTRVARFGFPPGQFRSVISIREECNARHSDMRNGIGCGLEQIRVLKADITDEKFGFQNFKKMNSIGERPLAEKQQK